MRFLKSALVAVLVVCAGQARADADLSGTYSCTDCNGFLEVSKAKGGSYIVDLVVSGGSCAGEVAIKKQKATPMYSSIQVHYKEKGAQCTYTIRPNADRVNVSNSCFTLADENGSTCAVLGDYGRQ